MPHLLIVDDTPANLLVMRRVLADLPTELVCVSSGAEALNACLNQDFALILLDVNMPIMDGYEVAQILMDDPRTRDTPIIFVTAAHGDLPNQIKGYRYGAVDFLSKPFNEGVLRAKVRVFLELWQQKQDLAVLVRQLEERTQLLEREVAERKRIEAMVRHQSRHDSLTGLPNRALLTERIDVLIEHHRRFSQPFALAYLDLDGFKPVNDQYGHPAGDELLIQVGERLQRHTRGKDTVSRLGGDEFVVLITEAYNLKAMEVVAAKLVKAIHQPFTLNNQARVEVGVSIGMAGYPFHAQTREALIQSADKALFEAKNAGKGQFFVCV
jgi:diguanylate cyclase (GGDEF)-like protein